MNNNIYTKMINTCEDKISKKGSLVGISFYAFFKNKNTDPETLFSVAEWWVKKKHKLDHFEKAEKIKKLAEHEKKKMLD